MDRKALNFEDVALQEALRQRKLLRKLDSRNETIKKLRQINYNIVEALNKSERTEEICDEGK